MTMEMRPSVAHGSGGASDPGPAPNQSGCVWMRPARCGAGPGCSYKAPGARERRPTHNKDLKCSCLVSLRPQCLASFPAARALADHKGAG